MGQLQIMISELLGTMMLIIIGNGVCFSVSHQKMFANQPGKWVVIALAWGLAVFMGVTVAGAMGGPGHINPAVSIYSAISNAIKTNGESTIELAYIPFQLAGAMLGQFLLNFINWKFIIETAQEGSATTRGAHATAPAFRNKEDKATIFNFSYELVGTAVLLTMILTFGHGINTAWTGAMGPIPVTLVIMALGMALGSATGYALNPARDLGPRLVYALLRPMMNKKSGVILATPDWAYAWVPVVAPATAGVVFGVLGLMI